MLEVAGTTVVGLSCRVTCVRPSSVLAVSVGIVLHLILFHFVLLVVT